MNQAYPHDKTGNGPSPAKKTYQSPQLRVYGNIGSITQGFGMVKKKDGRGAKGAMGFKSLPN